MVRAEKIPMRGRRLKKLVALSSNPTVVKDIATALSRGALDTAWRMARTATRTPDLGAEKIISRKYRLLWLCTPKVASRSTIAALRSIDPDAVVIRETRGAELSTRHPEVRDYTSCAFIRHPFDRALSLYGEIRLSPERYQGTQRLHKQEKRQFFLDRYYGLTEASSFEEYCRWLNTPYGSDALADRHFLSQHVQIRLEDGRMPDFVSCLENVDESWKRIAARVRMPTPELPMLNTMVGWQPSSLQSLQAARSEMRMLLTDRTCALLQTRYAADLQLYQAVSASGMFECL